MTDRPKRERKVPVRYGYDEGAEGKKSKKSVIDLTQDEPKPKRRATRKAVKQEESLSESSEESFDQLSDGEIPPMSDSESESEYDESAPLPRGWQMSVDDRGRTYYWNADTAKSQWTRPTASAQAPTPTLASPVAAPAASPIPEPGPRKKITATRAKSEYKLTDADLRELDCTTHENPHGPFLAPMRLFKEREVYRLAMLKHGSASGLLAARNKSKERGQKMAETRRQNEVIKQQQRASRQQEANALLARLNASSTAGIYSDNQLLLYVEKGIGSLGAIEVRLAQKIAQREAETARQSRTFAARAVLNRLNLKYSHLNTIPELRNYVQSAAGNLLDIEPQLASRLPELRRVERQNAAQMMLLNMNAPQTYMNSDEELAAYINTGEGNIAAIRSRLTGLVALQKKQQRQQQQQQPPRPIKYVPLETYTNHEDANNRRNGAAHAVGASGSGSNPPAGGRSRRCVVEGCKNFAPAKCTKCVCAPHAIKHCTDMNCTKHKKFKH